MKINIEYKIGDVVIVKFRGWFTQNCRVDYKKDCYIYYTENNEEYILDKRQLIHFYGKICKIKEINKSTGEFTIECYNNKYIIKLIDAFFYSLEEYKIIKSINEKCSECLSIYNNESICNKYCPLNKIKLCQEL